MSFHEWKASSILNEKNDEAETIPPANLKPFGGPCFTQGQKFAALIPDMSEHAIHSVGGAENGNRPASVRRLIRQ